MPVVVHATKYTLTHLGGSITAEMSRHRLNSCSRECYYINAPLFCSEAPSHPTASSVMFLEIAPGPYLKRWVEQCGGKCISLFRRSTQMTLRKMPALVPRSRVSDTSSTVASKNIDFNKFYALPEGVTNFTKRALEKNGNYMTHGCRNSYRSVVDASEIIVIYTIATSIIESKSLG